MTSKYEHFWKKTDLERRRKVKFLSTIGYQKIRKHKSPIRWQRLIKLFNDKVNNMSCFNFFLCFLRNAKVSLVQEMSVKWTLKHFTLSSSHYLNVQLFSCDSFTAFAILTTLKTLCKHSFGIWFQSLKLKKHRSTQNDACLVLELLDHNR